MRKWLALVCFIFLAFCVSYFASNSTVKKRNVILPGNIERIVSLNVAATQILVDLGLEDRIVGVNNTFSNPAQVKDMPKVGRGFGNINIEAILGLAPDIVFAYDSDVKILKERGINVFVVKTCNLNDVVNLVIEIGRTVNREPQARAIAGQMQKRIDDVRKKLEGVKYQPVVYFEAGAIGRTRAPGSLTHDLITMAGGSNLAKDEPVPFPLISNEYIIEKDPDVIILEEYGVSVEEVKKRDGWQNIKAVKDDKIFISRAVYTNYTPKCIEGLEQYARWLHPEAFEQ